jgi:hypothetical protein
MFFCDVEDGDVLSLALPFKKLGRGSGKKMYAPEVKVTRLRDGISHTTSLNDLLKRLQNFRWEEWRGLQG